MSQSAIATETDNPLVLGLERRPVAPTALVIFGATGDLAKRKLLPALYNLAHEGALPERFQLIGVSRKDKAHEEYRAECEQAIRASRDARPMTRCSRACSRTCATCRVCSTIRASTRNWARCWTGSTRTQANG